MKSFRKTNKTSGYQGRKQVDAIVNKKERQKGLSGGKNLIP